MKIDPDSAVVNEVCKLLKETRVEKGISQQRLSQDAGISRTGLRHIESLETNPTLFSLLKVANALNLKLQNVITRAEKSSQ